jgi:ankyrin repeat protein
MLGEKLVHEAEAGNLKGIEKLIARGIDVNSVNRFGVTALMAAALWGRPEVVKYLLKKGADITAAEKSSGCNALMYASLSGCSESVQYLVESGADVNAIDVLGRTPLMIASFGGHAEVVSLLLEKGADIHAETNKGVTAADFSAIEGHPQITALLIPSALHEQGVDARI